MIIILYSNVIVRVQNVGLFFNSPLLIYCHFILKTLPNEYGIDKIFTRAPKNTISTANSKIGGVGCIAVSIMK